MNQEMDWLKASLKGDTAAFERIVGQYQALVCSITLGATGRVETSEELAQETFLRAWKSLSQLKELDKFRAWLCSIARNCIQNYLRDQKHHAAVIPGSAELAEAVPSGSESVPENLIRKEEEAMMQQALMQIPQEYRDVLILFYRQQQSVQQVAAMLELTESNVRTRLHRGRELLREEVAGRIERTLERTTPGKNFTKAVMVAIGGLAVGTAATSQAAGVSTTATGTTTVLGGIGIKIAAAAAAVVIGAGALIYYANLPSQSEVSKPTILDSRPHANGAGLRGNDTSLEQTQVKETASAVNAVETKTKIAAAVPILEKSHLKSPVQKTIVEPNNAFEFKPRGVLSGLVTDIETGQPVTDAQLEMCTPTCDMVKTDEHGFYHFDKLGKEGNFNVGISSTDYVGIYDYDKRPVVNLQKDKHAVQHLQLKKACKLEILVTDPNGLPIEGARINATILSSDRSQEIGSSMYAKKTGKDGKILLGGFPPNDNYMITVTHSGPHIKVDGQSGIYKIGKWDYAPTGLKIYLDKPGEIEYAEVELEKGQVVRGIAKYQDGQPADDVQILAYPDWWHSNYCPQSVDVEPNGLFTLEQVVPGNYRIQVNIPTGGGSWSGRSLFSCALPLENDKLLDVKVPFNSPKSLASIRGRAKISGENKSSYIDVVAISSKREYYHGRMGNGQWGNIEGEFVIDRLEPGNYTVKFSGSEIEEQTINNVSAPSEGLEVVLECVGKPKLTGTVVDAQTQKPLEKFQVHVRKLQTLRGPNYDQPDQLITYVDQEGKFEIETVGPGIYQVQTQAKGYAPVWSEQINTDRNAPFIIALTAGGGSIWGMVLNEKGQSVQGAKVIPFSLAGGANQTTKDVFVSDKGSVMTDEKGRFELTNLASGQETLKVTHPDYAFTIKTDIPVTADRCTDNVKVVLQTGGTIEGFVYDADGNPLEGEIVYAQDKSGYSGSGDEEAGRFGTATSDPNGFYRIIGLPEQICYLRRLNEGSDNGVIRRTIFARLGKTVRVDFGGSVSLKGQVILDGKPQVNEKILLASDGNPHFGNFKAYTSTDAQGKFVFRGLVKGRLAVYRQQTDQRQDWIKLAAFESDGKELDLGTIPGQFGTVHLMMKQPPQAWKIARVFLIPKNSRSESMMSQDLINPDDPYVFTPVIPGECLVQIFRDDGLIFNRDVTIPENQKQVDLEIELPAGAARLSGTLSEDFTNIILTSEDKKIQKTISKRGMSQYEISNLPAGKYRMGLNTAMEERNSIPVYLSDGQETTVNIDGNSFEKTSPGMLYVQVLGDDGRLLEEAQVSLKAQGRVIEPQGHIGSDAFFMAQAGQYTLHITCQGYKDFEQSVTLNPLPQGQRVDPRKNKMTVFLESGK
jgi:RNA polymerase sigma factor (sigma-70 family)